MSGGTGYRFIVGDVCCGRQYCRVGAAVGNVGRGCFEKRKGTGERVMIKAKKMPWRMVPGDPARQGVTRTEQGFQFAVRVPEGKEASLLLYKKGSNSVAYEIPLPEEERVGEVNALLLEPMEAGKWEYNYRIAGEVKPDTYAKVIKGRETFGAPMPEEGMEHEIRGGLPEKMPLRTKPLQIPYEDTIIYKTHVRGFTKQKGSKVRKKGTFAGIVEKIPYLKELGITALELMPVYEFYEIPSEKTMRRGIPCDPDVPVRVNYWGFGPALYFAPKASYAVSSDPVAEFADMVDCLHQAGIECILEFYFQPNTNAGFVLDVLHYWQLNFGVDGFHLLGEGDWINLAARDVLLKKTKLIYLGYDMRRIYGDKGKPYYRNLGEHNLAFQQEMRRFLKGDEGSVMAASYRMRRNPERCGVINFFADHDGFTMADMVSYEEKHNEENGENNRDGSNQNDTWNCGMEGPTRKRTVRLLRERQLRNAWLMLLTAQGTPMIYGGDEFGNSTKGNNNSYCQDNEIGWLDWNNQKSNMQMLEFVKWCIAFRKAHPVLHMPAEPRMIDYKSCGCPDLSYHSERAWYNQMEYDSRFFGEMYCGSYAEKTGGTEDDFIYIAYNMHWNSHTLALPTLPGDKRWVLAVDTSAADGYDLRGQEKMLGEQRKLIVPPRTVMILVSEACPDDSENGHLLQKKKANGEKQEEKAVKEETQPENENRMVVE